MQQDVRQIDDVSGISQAEGSDADQVRREALAAMVQQGIDAGVYDVMLDQEFVIADNDDDDDLEPVHLLGCDVEHFHLVPDCCAPACWCRSVRQEGGFLYVPSNHVPGSCAPTCRCSLVKGVS